MLNLNFDQAHKEKINKCGGMVTVIKESGKKYMEQIRNMLNNFEIKSSPVRLDGFNIRTDGTKSVGLRFDIEKRYFENFYKEVGFENKLKTERLIIAMRGQN